MRSDISQSYGAGGCMIPLKFVETESRKLVARGWVEEGIWSDVLTGTEFPFGKMKRALWMDGSDGCPTQWMYLMVKMVNFM